MNPPETIDELMREIRIMLTPRDDKYGADEVVLMLGNAGWVAGLYHGWNTDQGDIFKPTAYEAMLEVWKWVLKIPGSEDKLKAARNDKKEGSDYGRR